MQLTLEIFFKREDHHIKKITGNDHELSVYWADLNINIEQFLPAVGSMVGFTMDSDALKNRGVYIGDEFFQEVEEEGFFEFEILAIKPCYHIDELGNLELSWIDMDVLSITPKMSKMDIEWDDKKFSEKYKEEISRRNP